MTSTWGRRAKVAVGLVLTGVLATACQSEFSAIRRDKSPEELWSLVEVFPLAVDFGELSSADVDRETITVRNTGRAVLNLDVLELDGPSSFRLADAPGIPSLIDAEETITFDVVFQPEEPGDLSAVIRLGSDALDNPEVTIDVTGFGAIPEIEVTPASWTAGTVLIPCGEETVFSITNNGNEPLEITDIDLRGADTRQVRLGFNPPLPLTLRTGQVFQLPVEIPADALAGVDAELVISSNDPDGDVVVPITGNTAYLAQPVDTFTFTASEPVNFLFAVDQSCSMDDENAAIGAQFNTFISTIGQATAGWKIGVVTADTGCFNNGVLTSSSASVASKFASAVQAGSDGQAGYSNTERLFTLVSSALGRTGPSGCNAGFLDAGAPLHVVFVSDENEQSGGAVNGFVTTWRSYVSAPDDLVAHAVVDYQRRCGDGSGAERYRDSVLLTQGFLADICQGNFAFFLQDIAASATAQLGAYTPSRTGLDPDSVSVTVNGQPYMHWRWDGPNGRVVLTQDPPTGAAVEVEYGVFATCN